MFTPKLGGRDAPSNVLWSITHFFKMIISTFMRHRRQRALYYKTTDQLPKSLLLKQSYVRQTNDICSATKSAFIFILYTLK